MRMAELSDWGYHRRNYTRYSSWTTGSPSYPTGSGSYTVNPAVSQPASSYIGGYYLTRTKETMQLQDDTYYRYKETLRQYFVHMKFAIPSSAVSSALLRIYIPAQSYSSTIGCYRLTSAADANGNDYPSYTTTNMATAKTLVGGGWLEFDITNLINDAISAGVWYGIGLNHTKAWLATSNVITFSQTELGGGIAGGSIKGKICINGEWKNIVSGKICIGGAWKNAKASKITIGGEWK